MIRSIQALTFLALSISPVAWGASANQATDTRKEVTSAQSTEARSTPLFAKVSEDHFMALVDRAYEGVGTRGLNAVDHARVRRIAVATAIYEVLFDMEASYDDVLAIAVQQAQSEGIRLDYVDPNEIPQLMTAENPMDALMWQHDLLGALDSLHQKAWNDLMDRISSQWPGMTQDLCDAIMGAMLFNGGDGTILESLKAAAAAYYKERYGEEAYDCAMTPQNYVVGECAEYDNTEKTTEQKLLESFISSCFDRPTFYYASDVKTVKEWVSVTIQVERNLDRLGAFSALSIR